MNFRRTVCSTLAMQLALVTVAPAAALADTKAAAQQLFDEGATLMAKKDFAAACPKLKASMDLEPLDGTVLRLAVCYQGLGKWASAWALFKESVVRAEKAGRKDRVDLALKGIADVEKKLSYVTIDVKSDARTSGLEVKLDGEKIVDGTFGAALPIDPGDHTVAAAAAGKKPWEQAFAIGSTSEKKTIVIAKLDDAPAAATTTAAPLAPTAAPTASDTAPARDGPPTAGTPTGAYVAFGAAVVFLGGAIGARLKMNSEKNSYFQNCTNQLVFECQDPDGRSRVRTWETLSWVSGGVAVAAVGIGITLIVTNGSKDAKKQGSITASPGAVGRAPVLMISGSF